jgi:hypothetical protein
MYRQATLEIIMNTSKGKKKFLAENIMGRGDKVAPKVTKFLLRHNPSMAVERMETIYNFMERELARLDSPEAED